MKSAEAGFVFCLGSVCSSLSHYQFANPVLCSDLVQKHPEIERSIADSIVCGSVGQK